MRARNFDWDPIRGLHHGQQARCLHSKAVDMTANDRPAEPISPLRDRGRPDMTPEAWKQLRMLSLNLGSSTQSLGEDAINLLFEKHRLNRIA
jgi:hypothetical protein